MPWNAVCWNITHIFWSFGFLNCCPHVLKCCLLNYYPHVLKCWSDEIFTTDFEVLFWWTLPDRSWNVGLLFCYPHALKCCLLKYYPHILKFWFFELLPTCLEVLSVKLLPTCYEVLVCWTDTHMLWSFGLLKPFPRLWWLLGTTVRPLLYFMAEYTEKLNTHSVFGNHPSSLLQEIINTVKYINYNTILCPQIRV